MAKADQKIKMSPSRDIPFNKLVLSQSNVRRTKAGISIEDLAEDIPRRRLLQGLNVRPILDADGQESGMFDVPAGGRRYRALELLVKQKRLAKTAPIPCIVSEAGTEISAEEDSLHGERAPRRPSSSRPVSRRDRLRRQRALALRRKADGFDVDAVKPHGFNRPWAPASGNDAADATTLPPPQAARGKDAAPSENDLQPDD